MRTDSKSGLQAQGVVGHSVGEVTAAYAAGVFDLATAVRLLHRRAFHMQSELGRGAMASVSCSAEVLRPHLPAPLSIAAYNDSASTLISGPKEELDPFCQRLAVLGIDSTPVRVAFAFHSPAMGTAGQALAGELAGLLPASGGSLSLYSTVLGERVEAAALNAEYWGRNVIEPVRFLQAISAMVRDGYDTFIELAPHAVLSRSIQAMVAPSIRPRVVSTLRRERDELQHMGAAVDHLFRIHCQLDWSRLQSPAARCVRLPSYPFQRQAYWMEESSVPALPEPAEAVPAQAVRPQQPTFPDAKNSDGRPHSYQAVIDFLLGAAAQVLAVPARSLHAELEIARLATDSLAFLELLGQIEAEFAVRLSLQSLAQRARTLGDLATLIAGSVESSPAFSTSAAVPCASAWREQVDAAYERAFAGLPVARERVRTGAHELEVFSVGSGRPVVVLPAWQAMITAWAPFMRKLGQEYRIIGMHYPGYGLSAGPLLDIDELASLVGSTLEQLALPLPHLIGWSLGGLIAQRLAARQPLQSLTLINTTACLQVADSASEMHRLMSELHGDFERSTQALGQDDVAERTALFDSIKATDQAEVFLHYAGIILRHDNREQLKGIHTPTLVVAGGRDAITTVAHGHYMAQTIPGATLQVLPEAGHYIPLLHTGWLAEKWRELGHAHCNSVADAAHFCPQGKGL